jgi:hypothetical protein
MELSSLDIVRGSEVPLWGVVTTTAAVRTLDTGTVVRELALLSSLLMMPTLARRLRRRRRPLLPMRLLRVVTTEAGCSAEVLESPLPRLCCGGGVAGANSGMPKDLS